MKVCNTCLLPTPLTEFYKKARNLDGREYTCKTCLKPDDNDRARKRSEGPQKPKRKRTKAQLLCDSFDRIVSRAALKLALSKISQKDFDRVVAIMDGKKKEAILQGRREWLATKEGSYNEYQRKRRIVDPAFRAIRNTRARLSGFLAEKPKHCKSLGCSFDEFKKHIEFLFQPGMTWDNYGDWELDHVNPLSVAHLEGPEAFARACRYTNLQPLWKLAHRVKTTKDIRLFKSLK